jgi:hypothetical protein
MENVHTLVIASYLFGKSCMTLFWILDGDTHSFPVYRSFHCLVETGMLGVLKIMVIPYRRAQLQLRSYYELSFMAYATFWFQQVEVLVLCLEQHCS